MYPCYQLAGSLSVMNTKICHIFLNISVIITFVCFSFPPKDTTCPHLSDGMDATWTRRPLHIARWHLISQRSRRGTFNIPTADYIIIGVHLALLLYRKTILYIVYLLHLFIGQSFVSLHSVIPIKLNRDYIVSNFITDACLNIWSLLTLLFLVIETCNET